MDVSYARTGICQYRCGERDYPAALSASGHHAARAERRRARLPVGSPEVVEPGPARDAGAGSRTRLALGLADVGVRRTTVRPHPERGRAEPAGVPRAARPNTGGRHQLPAALTRATEQTH